MSMSISTSIEFQEYRCSYLDTSKYVIYILKTLLDSRLECLFKPTMLHYILILIVLILKREGSVGSLMDVGGCLWTFMDVCGRLWMFIDVF